jgi:hypothetical protein
LVQVLIKKKHYVLLMDQWHGEKKIMFMVKLNLRLYVIKVCFFVDISTNQFPANYFDRHAAYFKYHDRYNNSIRKE